MSIGAFFGDFLNVVKFSENVTLGWIILKLELLHEPIQ
jgi:hypothetical protein